MDNINDVRKFGKKARGKTERVTCLEGKSLTRDQAIRAHCYDCTGSYADGAQSCGIKTCSLYQYHPYKGA